MGRFELTHTQQRGIIAGMLAMVLLVGTIILVRGPSGEEGEAAGPGDKKLAAQIQPGGYVLTNTSWGSVGQTISSQKKPPKAAPQEEIDLPVAPVVEVESGDGLTGKFRDLFGMPISVGGK